MNDNLYCTIMGFLGVAVIFPFFLGSTIGWGVAIAAGGVMSIFCSLYAEIKDMIAAHKKAKRLAKEIRDGIL